MLLCCVVLVARRGGEAEVEDEVRGLRSGFLSEDIRGGWQRQRMAE